MNSDHSQGAMNRCMMNNQCGGHNLGNLDPESKAEVMRRFNIDEAKLDFVAEKFRQDLLDDAKLYAMELRGEASTELVDSDLSPISMDKNGNLNA